VNMKRLIYAVDDEESIRDLYYCLIEQAGYEVKCFENGYQLFEILKTEIPDLFILDIMLDEMDGFEILKKIRQDYKLSNVPIIMVSAKGEEISKVKGFNLGADDYIEKPFGIMEFIARINSKLRFKQNQKQRFIYKDLLIEDEKHEVYINKQLIDLSITEYNLLLFLIINNNKAIQRKEIWNKVWKDEFIGETRSLDMHITKLRKKLTESNVIIESIRGIGYKLK
ncbi:MAG: response regulator transcription factor, partial [Bacilli bacterium]|nr:response regulator transcription factor [Bacilli bacterium]